MRHDSLGTRATRLAVLGVFSITVGFSVGVLAAPGWTPWVSSANGGLTTICQLANEAASGFDCSGNHCSSVRLHCDTLPFGITVSEYSWTSFFSSHDNGVGSVTSEGWYRLDNSFSHVCKFSGAAGILTGIRCSGSSCSSISLECATPYTHFEGVREPVQFKNCYWSGSYSEDNPPLILPPFQFITGVECSGSRCGDKRFYICTAQAAEDSCSGTCGSQARGGCFCDSACLSYNDCCSDYEAACVPI